MRRMHLLLLGLCLGALPMAASAQAVRYELDPVHTRVLFAVSHAGFSHALGTVSGSSGELWFDPEDWASARLQATVPLARLDLGDAKWNKAALAANLLDVDKHPQASFVSTRIEAIDASHAAVHGTLTLHGVAREVKLDVTLNAAKRHPMPPFRRTVGFSATTSISRKDFGIDAWPSVIGDTVELRIEAEATRARGDDSNDTQGPEVEQPTVFDGCDECAKHGIEPAPPPTPEQPSVEAGASKPITPLAPVPTP